MEYRDRFQSIEFSLLSRQKEKTTFILANNGSCLYVFNFPSYLSFALPPAQPNSPGDTVLNSGYPIQFFFGALSYLGCNTGKCSYQTPNGTFSSTYIDSNGQSSSIENQFGVGTFGELMAYSIPLEKANMGNGREIFCNDIERTNVFYTF